MTKPSAVTQAEAAFEAFKRNNRAAVNKQWDELSPLSQEAFRRFPDSFSKRLEFVCQNR